MYLYIHRQSCVVCFYGDGVVQLYLWSFYAKVEGLHYACYLAGCICRLFDLSFCCPVVFSFFRGENQLIIVLSCCRLFEKTTNCKMAEIGHHIYLCSRYFTDKILLQTLHGIVCLFCVKLTLLCYDFFMLKQSVCMMYAIQRVVFVVFSTFRFVVLSSFRYFEAKIS